MVYQSRQFIGTWFPSVVPDPLELPISFKNTLIESYCCQWEKCPSSQKIHLQLCFRLLKKSTLTGAIAAIGLPGVHLEHSKGSWEQCLKYCSKSESRLEGPYQSLSTKSTAISTSSDVLGSLKRMTPLELIDLQPTLWRNYRTLKEISLEVNPLPARDTMPEVWWLWGAPGTGKSKIAHLIGSFSGFHSVSLDEPYFNSYTQQPLLLFDDISAETWITGTFFKKVCDRYALNLRRKLDTPIPLNSPLIIFTSNFSPYECFPKEPTEALNRRIKYIKYFG